MWDAVQPACSAGRAAHAAHMHTPEMNLVASAPYAGSTTASMRSASETPPMRLPVLWSTHLVWGMLRCSLRYLSRARPGACASVVPPPHVQEVRARLHVYQPTSRSLGCRMRDAQESWSAAGSFSMAAPLAYSVLASGWL